MKNQELFNKTVNILVNAYQKNNLKHGDCSACAVGNLIASNSGIANNHRGEEWRAKFGIDVNETPYQWSNCFVSSGSVQSRYFNEYTINDIARKQIDSTGYSLHELAMIEFSFEIANKGANNAEWMFNGLMSVVDTLMSIHEANKTQASQAKKLFVKETA